MTAIADKLGVEFALIHRERRGKPDGPEKMELLVGDVRGKVAILVDDMIDTGTTLALAARTLADNGAAKTYAIVSHGAPFSPLVSVALPNLVFLPGLLSETNMKMIESLPIEQLVVRNFSWLRTPSRPPSTARVEPGTTVPYLLSHTHALQVTNTVPQKSHEAACSKLVTVDVSPTIAESIRRTHNGESISFLFGDWAEEAGVNGVY